jgi:hypothetical protein
MKYVFQPCYALGQSRRIATAAPLADRMTVIDLGILAAAGAAAAVAVAALPPPVRGPGHAILKATLPIVAGMALAPRRMAGGIMAVAALLTVLLLSGLNIGQWQPPALMGLLAIGPAIDVALSFRPSSGWRLYLRFALAGLLANTLAFFARGGESWLGLDGFRWHALTHINGVVFLYFAACGVAAGLLSSVICFRSSAKKP